MANTLLPDLPGPDVPVPNATLLAVREVVVEWARSSQGDLDHTDNEYDANYYEGKLAAYTDVITVLTAHGWAAAGAPTVPPVPFVYVEYPDDVDAELTAGLFMAGFGRAVEMAVDRWRVGCIEAGLVPSTKVRVATVKVKCHSCNGEQHLTLRVADPAHPSWEGWKHGSVFYDLTAAAAGIPIDGS